MARDNSIAMYWWEGFYGFNNLFQRIIKGKKPFVRNFGDLLSPLIISLLTNKDVKHTISSNKLLALGSIFFGLRDKDLVWGSGFLNAKHIQFALASSEVSYLAVRGPETRKLLMQHHIACPEIYGDPAILLPQLVKNDITKKYAIGIVPHFSQYHYFQNLAVDDVVSVINVEKSVAEVMRNILACEVILATSLHGLIVAEAYNIPALLLIIDQPLHGDFFKFEDYFHATNRALSYAKFDRSKINALADLAVNQNKPVFDTNKLLKSFPFEMNKLSLNPSTLSWSNMNDHCYKHSMVPPKLSVP